MKRIAIITTHPIQYYAPLYKLLAERKNIELKVFYTWGEGAKNNVFDPGFGKQREWDIPLLEGYAYEFVKNISKSPGSSHFKGIINPDIVERINSFRPNALLVQGWAFHSHLKILRKFKGKIPIYFRGDSTLLDESPSFSLKKIARRIFLTWVYRHIDKAFYVGTNNKAYYLRHGIINDQLVYTPHAIDNNRFFDSNNTDASQVVQWKKELSIPTNKVAVLFAGKLEKKKNPFFIVEAAKKMPHLFFIIVGNGILEQEIKDQIQNLSNCILLPFQNQSKMPLVYRLADIFVLPSQGPGETWGLAINEAMACGRLIVASNKSGGAIDLIANGENGYIIEPTLNSTLDALNKIIDNPWMLENGGVASIKKIQDFSYAHIAEAIENEINQN